MELLKKLLGILLDLLKKGLDLLRGKGLGEIASAQARACTPSIGPGARPGRSKRPSAAPRKCARRSTPGSTGARRPGRRAW